MPDKEWGESSNETIKKEVTLIPESGHNWGEALERIDGDDIKTDSIINAAEITTRELKIWDTNRTHTLGIIFNEDDTANRRLNLLVAGGDRSLTLNENFTIGDGTDITITGAGQANSITLNESLTIGDGNDGTLTYSASGDTLTIGETLTLTGASGMTLTLNENLTIGNGTDITITGIGQANALTLNENLIIGDGYDVSITALGQTDSITLNESLVIGDGYDGTLTYSATSKTATVEDNAIISQDYTPDSTTVQFAGLDMSDGNITSVGDIALDTITSDGSTITIGLGNSNSIVLTDNTTTVVNLGTDAGDDFSINNGSDILLIEGDTNLSTFTGNVLISKATPEIKLTDTGDSNDTRWIRTDTLSQMNLYNTVNVLSNSNALDFDGSNDFVNPTSNPLASIGTGDMTIVMWIHPDNWSDLRCVFSNQSSFSSTGFSFTAINGSKIGVYTQSAFLATSSSNSINLGSWVLVGFVRNSASGAESITIYINGSADGTGDANNKSFSTTSTYDIFASLGSPSGFRYLNGRMDEAAIYTRALTADDFSDLWNGGSGLFIDKDDNFPTSGTSMGLNLEILYHFDSDSGSSTTDSSGNSNTGTLNNMTDDDWVPGKVTAGLSSLEISVIQSKYEAVAGVTGAQTYGIGSGKTIFDGRTIHFNIGSVETGNMDANGDWNFGVDSDHNLIGISTITIANTGLHILDTGGDHDLIIKPGTDLGADRTLTITTGDADRTITLSGNPTLNDWFDQSVKTTAAPGFATGVTIGNLTLANGSITDSSSAITFNDENLSTTGTFGSGTITIANGGSLNLQEDISFTGATTENLIKFPDNLVDALSIQEGANKYITFDSTDDAEHINLLKRMDIQTDKIIICNTYTDEGINACIDALGAEGGCVILPEGTYTIDGTITIDYNNTTLKGMGWGTILDASSWSTDHVINLNATDFGQIKDLQIIGNTGGGNAKDLINDGGVSTNWLLENLYLKDFDQHGIWISNGASDYNKISGCFIDNGDHTGILSSGKFSIIKSNIVINTPRGFNIVSTRGQVQNNIAAFGATFGFILSGSESIINNNVSYFQGSVGFEISGNRNTISNNVADQNGRQGFYILTDNSSITSNLAYRNGNNYNGFHMKNADNNEIGVNFAEGAAGREEYGFYFENSNNNNFVGGKSHSHDTGGIFIDSNSQNNHVIWNHLEGESVSTITNNGGATNTIINAIAGDVILNGNYDIVGGLQVNLVSKTSAYTLTKSDYTVLCDASGGAFTITLPAVASHVNRIYHIKKIDNSANAVTVDGNDAELVEFALTLALTVRGESVTLQSSGSAWYIL